MKASGGVLFPLEVFYYFSGLFPNIPKTQKRKGGLEMKTKKSFYSKILLITVAFLIIFGSSRAFGYEWSKTFGGSSSNDEGRSVQQTSDGGYIIAANMGREAHIIKTDPDGKEQWDKELDFGVYTGYDDLIASVQQTTDGGYAALITESYGAVRQPFVELIKTDADGEELWIKEVGGGDGTSFQQTSDSGYIIIIRHGSDWDSCPCDIELKRTDGDGNELWSKTFGGSDDIEETPSSRPLMPAISLPVVRTHLEQVAVTFILSKQTLAVMNCGVKPSVEANMILETQSSRPLMAATSLQDLQNPLVPVEVTSISSKPTVTVTSFGAKPSAVVKMMEGHKSNRLLIMGSLLLGQQVHTVTGKATSTSLKLMLTATNFGTKPLAVAKMIQETQSSKPLMAALLLLGRQDPLGREGVTSILSITSLMNMNLPMSLQATGPKMPFTRFMRLESPKVVAKTR